MKSKTHSSGSKAPTKSLSQRFEANILHMVKGAHERRAIQSGEVDAIIDAANGRVILLPEAQAALFERKARFRSLVELSTDGYWDQDDQYRFLTHSGAPIGNVRSGESILGKTLWELPFDNGNEIDWATHQTQLQWRAIFRDFELRCVDRDNRLRTISISGEPMLDADGRFKGYHGITRDVTEQKQAREAAPESERFARDTLDALATQVCVLDASGSILRANTAWRVLAATHRGSGADVLEGDNYLSVCDRIVGDQRVDAAAMAAGIRQVVAGERELFRYEYVCDAPSGTRWFMATATRLRRDGVERAIVSYEDITELKQAEQLLKLECSVARSLVDSGNTQSPEAVIRAVCETQQWDCGRYFRLDTASNLLRLEASWGRPTPAVEQFMEKSRSVEFRPGAGLAGRVYQSGEPLWILSDSKNARAAQTALAHEVGDSAMHGAFVFPVSAAGKTIGVLAFASAIVREPDDRLLQAVRNIGLQLGQFLQRQQDDDDLRAIAIRFRRLTELSSDWHWEQDSQFRFTRIVGPSIAAASEMLGKTLWDLPNVMADDDQWIKHKSELTAQWSFCDFECAVVRPDGRQHHYRISGEPLYDKADKFIGFHGTGLDITRGVHREIETRETASEHKDNTDLPA
jgi:PAS domain S-box-containing protein